MSTLFGTDGIRGRAFSPPLDEDTVRRLAEAGPEVEEVYSLTAGGAVEVTIRVPSDGFERTWRLGRQGA